MSLAPVPWQLSARLGFLFRTITICAFIYIVLRNMRQT